MSPYERYTLGAPFDEMFSREGNVRAPYEELN